VEITVEIDPLEALVEDSATRTRLSKTKFWNGPDWKSPYLIVVLISCIKLRYAYYSATKEYLVSIFLRLYVV
jgi:hypothetical protein